MEIDGIYYSVEFKQVSEDTCEARCPEIPEFGVVVGTDPRDCVPTVADRIRLTTDSARRSKHQRKVDKFMRLVALARRKAGLSNLAHDLPMWPAVPSREILKLRASLILEEALETIYALGMDVEGNKIVDAGRYCDVVQVVDGCFDLRYVTTGTLSDFGVPDSGQDIVDDNNLMKFEPGFKIREDGKLIKPTGFVGPRIKEWLDAKCNIVG